MMRKLKLLLILVVLFHHCFSYNYNRDSNIDISDESINLSQEDNDNSLNLDEVENDDDSINLNEQNDNDSINISEELFDDDRSLNDNNGNEEDEKLINEDESSNERHFFKNAQLDSSQYEDFFDIEMPVSGSSDEFHDLGGTGLRNEAEKWPQVGNRIVVPFEINKASKYTKEQQRNIITAMKEIQSKTCIKFIKRGLERNYIEFKSDRNKGCSSKLGMKEGGQVINLNKSKSCANVPGIIMHEILHSLGFYHMHSHSQRDQYINIIWDNIDPSRNPDYRAADTSLTSSYNTKYDFYSVMHYAPIINGKRVIKPKQKYMYYDKYMGQRKALSEGDIERINNMYRCSKVLMQENRIPNTPPKIENPQNITIRVNTGRTTKKQRTTTPSYGAETESQEITTERWRNVNELNSRFNNVNQVYPHIPLNYPNLTPLTRQFSNTQINRSPVYVESTSCVNGRCVTKNSVQNGQIGFQPINTLNDFHSINQPIGSFTSTGNGNGYSYKQSWSSTSYSSGSG
ncbi:hypothetical protein PVAND_014283 [Polypedilum vanderplanki]|uniref:Metalloendopeptidase n=1 Tax=Polypedilum vanderplanki TaxID=319348 RepID=A0A9J6CRV5_POLVA|nr:hypothetical protein PVAND_014283 [Polypedilum vanderplanki]